MPTDLIAFGIWTTLFLVMAIAILASIMVPPYETPPFKD